MPNLGAIAPILHHAHGSCNVAVPIRVERHRANGLRRSPVMLRSVRPHPCRIDAASERVGLLGAEAETERKWKEKHRGDLLHGAISGKGDMPWINRPIWENSLEKA